MKIIKSKEILIAKIIEENDWNDGLSFFSEDNEFMQVGTWNYQSGTMLKPHIHNIVERKINRTQEVLFIKSGRIKASFYEENGEFITSENISSGNVVILLNGGHGYEILEDDTKVLEIKNGPYLGAETDRRRIDE